MISAASLFPAGWLSRIGLIVLAFVLFGCEAVGAQRLSTSTAPAATQTATVTPKPPTATPTLTATASPSPTVTRTPAPTATPEPLAAFETRLLTRGIEPAAYVTDTCEYLYMRWNPDNAEPGTVVVPVMYHSVVKDGRPVRDNMSVTAEYFRYTMEYARELGFETITTAELIDFLYNNARIPNRSLFLVVDDRRPGVVRNHFLPILEEYDWTVTLGYITGVVYPYEWNELAFLHATGRIDVQAHGFMHNGQTYFTEFTSEEIIRQELYDPIPVIEERFGTRPYAFVWPGGNFTPRTVDEARKAGYRVGLTAYSRGPLMFNWIPLGEPEREMNDPLMVLPRYWSTAATVNLDQAVAINEAARAFAEEHQEEELAWYRQYCSGYPDLPLSKSEAE